jgi:hypothetical protein
MKSRLSAVLVALFSRSRLRTLAYHRDHSPKREATPWAVGSATLSHHTMAYFDKLDPLQGLNTTLPRNNSGSDRDSNQHRDHCKAKQKTRLARSVTVLGLARSSYSVAPPDPSSSSSTIYHPPSIHHVPPSSYVHVYAYTKPSPVVRLSVRKKESASRAFPPYHYH